MTTLSGTFTETQQSTAAPFFLRAGEVVRVTLTFTGTARIALERMVGPNVAGRPIAQFTESTTGYDYRNETGENIYVRLLALSVNPGSSVAYTLADVAGDQILEEWRAADGTLAFRITDQGPVGGVVGHAIDVRVNGALGGSNDDTVAFELTAAQAAATGAGRVLVPFDTFTVDAAGADASGCAVIGNGKTVLSGIITNAAYLDGFVVAGINQRYAAQHPTIPFDATLKAIRWIDANTYHVLVSSARQGYVLLVFKNNVTTTNNSLAATASDETQFRLTGMLHVVEVLTGYTTHSATSGTWSTTSLSAGVPTFDAGNYYNYPTTSESAAYREFTVTVPADGFLSVTFLRAAAGSGGPTSTDVDVTVDGTLVDEALDLSLGAGADRITRVYSVLPGARVVRCTNNASAVMGVIGLNFAPLKSQRDDVDLDTIGSYRNAASFISPIDANSANDYAIKRASDGIYGGSYHGGESDFALDILVDGADVTLAALTPLFIGRSIELIQTSTIAWTAPAEEVDVTMRYVFHLGGCSWALTLDGALTASEYYTVLVGLNEEYTHLGFPRSVAFAGLADNERYSVGQTQAVEYRSATTGQRLRITHSTYTDMENRYGGAFIWKVVGSYLKYYNAYIHTGSREVPALAAVVTLQAS